MWKTLVDFLLSLERRVNCEKNQNEIEIKSAFTDVSLNAVYYLHAAERFHICVTSYALSTWKESRLKIQLFHLNFD